MKLPNNYGSVYKLSGNRRRPYIAKITIIENRTTTIVNICLSFNLFFQSINLLFIFPTKSIPFWLVLIWI